MCDAGVCPIASVDENVYGFGYTLTGRLRWLVKGEQRILQQEWVTFWKGIFTEWRDVPEVIEITEGANSASQA